MKLKEAEGKPTTVGTRTGREAACEVVIDYSLFSIKLSDIKTSLARNYGFELNDETFKFVENTAACQGKVSDGIIRLCRIGYSPDCTHRGSKRVCQAVYDYKIRQSELRYAVGAF